MPKGTRIIHLAKDYSEFGSLNNRNDYGNWAPKTTKKSAVRAPDEPLTLVVEGKSLFHRRVIISSERLTAQVILSDFNFLTYDFRSPCSRVVDCDNYGRAKHTPKKNLYT